MSDYHEPGRCSCATTVTQIDAECLCACHGPHLTVVCAWCKDKKPLRLEECGPGEAGKISHGICAACFAEQNALIRKNQNQEVGGIIGYRSCRKCGAWRWRSPLTEE